MTRSKIFMTTMLAAATAGSLALADANHGQNGQMDATPQNGPSMHSQNLDMGGDMMGMMQNMHRQMMQMMQSGMMGQDMTGTGDMMDGDMMQMFDTDENGMLTAKAMRTQLQAKLKQYDANADGALSIAEFEALHSAMFRNQMVDRFQAFDEDGDGSITREEMLAPADMMMRLQGKTGKQGHMQSGQSSEMGTDMDGDMMDQDGLDDK